MLVNSVSNSMGFNIKKISRQKYSVATPSYEGSDSNVTIIPPGRPNNPGRLENYGIGGVSFKGGKNPEVLKNQLKILLTQNIFENKLMIKMPENPLEKEVLLEVLQNRLKLDRLVRLKNEKAGLTNKINHINTLLKENPSHPDLPQLINEIEKRGNTKSIINGIDKQIEIEIKKKKPAYDYFENIKKLEEEYLEKKLIKVSGMDKFWHQIRKNNINPDEKFSTEELIDIISGKQAHVASESKLLKEQLLAKIEKQYEQFWRENYDVYEGSIHTDAEAQKVLKKVYDTNVVLVEKYPDTKKQILKIYADVEQRYRDKIKMIPSNGSYPIGKIWKDMDGFKASIKKTMHDIFILKRELNKNPGNMKTRADLSIKEKSLAELKQDWIEGLKSSVEYENLNREKMTAAGRGAEYDYLTSENRTIKKHKVLYEIYKNNNNSIPDNIWADILV